MDLSKLSDADLMALKSGDLSKVSDAGLMQLKGGLAEAPPSKMDQFVAGVKASPVTQALYGGVRGAAGIGATLQHYL